MIRVGFVPNIAPPNNSTVQIRRRTNQLVSAAAQLDAEKAPSASPTFSGTVQQPEPPVLTGAGTSTAANAGGATALPATPLGYLKQVINGVNVRIPYYAE